MYASFERLGRRDLKTLAKQLHKILSDQREPLNLAACRDVVAQLHGHASWASAQASEQGPQRLDPHWQDPSVLGYDLTARFLSLGRKRVVRLPDEWARSPRLLLGSTGSGITETMLSMLLPAMAQGQGLAVVEGRGDSNTVHHLMNFARWVGRDEEVQVLNFMTGGRDEVPEEFLRYNPFERDDLTALQAWLYPSVFEALPELHDRSAANAVLDGLFEVLLRGRDAGLWPLDSARVVRALRWDALQALRQGEPLTTVAGLQHRLSVTLQALGDTLDTQAQAFAVYEAALAQALAYAEHLPTLSARMSGSLWTGAELDWRESIVQRRIVVVVLPAIEKSSEALHAFAQHLVRQMAHALREVHATTEPAVGPATWAFLDGGYFLNDALVALACDSMGLDVSLNITAMDYGHLKHRSKVHAQALMEHMGVKVFMKAHDPEVVEHMLPYMDHREPTAQLLRGLHQDLLNQEPGEAHVGWGNTLQRVQMAYHYLAVPREPMTPLRWPSTWHQAVQGDLP